MAEGREVTAGVIGVIGVGEIAEAMVTGLLGEDAGAPDRVVLSPRGAARAAGLAAGFDAVSVAPSNAEVAEAADTVIVSVRPDQLTEALDGVRFRPGQLVISTLAGVDLATLRDAVGGSDAAEPSIVRSVPLPPVARRAGVTPVIPADPRAVALFDLLGGHLAVDDEEQMATVTVLTGAQTGLLQYIAELCRWAADNGLDPASSEMFIRNTVAGLEPGLRDATTPIGGLIDNFETEGGLNWQLRTGFFDDLTTGALTRELDTLHRRVRGE
ncbi:NAD(P)-binding domain-containing protein [uncultured Corynebacterium sp.]|mgnify:CR=1 FL=1|uniref:NAD(P)-binding domain-containing protein n=1 Tax=uncultured Corynebacterium sp. TaxID=159447 RepID=UPI00259689AA|nr:NAD(P)-binding domain-containing protein [uncultured Corynebacterium sp.]